MAGKAARCGSFCLRARSLIRRQAHPATDMKITRKLNNAALPLPLRRRIAHARHYRDPRLVERPLQPRNMADRLYVGLLLLAGAASMGGVIIYIVQLIIAHWTATAVAIVDREAYQ